MRHISKCLQHLSTFTLIVLLSACGGSSDSANDKPAPPATTTLTLQLKTDPSARSINTQDISVLFDGKKKTFQNKLLIIKNVNINTAHTIIPSIVQTKSTDGKKISRCGALPLTISANTLTTGDAAYTINYKCKNSTIVSGNFTTSNTTPSTCKALKQTYNANIPTTTTAEPKPYYLTAGLLVHIMADNYDRKLLNGNTTACVYPKLCGSIFWQKLPPEFITSTQASGNWPPDVWAFSYIHKNLKAQQNMQPLYQANPKNIAQNSSLVFGIALNPKNIPTTDTSSTTSDDGAPFISCSYPRDAHSDLRRAGDKTSCACGALGDNPNPSTIPATCKKPIFTQKPPSDYANNFFVVGCDTQCNFKPFENNASGFNNMVAASEKFTKLHSCNNGDNNNAPCNSACPSSDPNTPCNAFNEVDISSDTWGNIQNAKNADPIKAVFALCNNDPNSQNPCDLATLNRALDVLNKSYGPSTSYPIKQTNIPIVLLDINALMVKPTAKDTQSSASDDPFICPAS